MLETIGAVPRTVQVEYTHVDDLRRDYLAYISHNGYVIETDRSPGLWDTIRLQFSLPGEKRLITVIGKVVKIQPDTAQAGGAHTFAVYLELLDLDDGKKARFEKALGHDLTPVAHTVEERVPVHNFDEAVRESAPAETLEYRFHSWAEMSNKYKSDLSSGGVNILSDRLIPVNSPVTVRLIPPDRKVPLELTGTVVSHVALGESGLDSMDIVFDEVARAKERLQDYVLSALKRAGVSAAAPAPVEKCVFSGVVSHHGIPDLVKMICQNQHDGRIRLIHGEEEAEINVQSGQIHSARMAQTEFPIDGASSKSSLSLRVLRYLLDWEEAEFQVFRPALSGEVTHY